MCLLPITQHAVGTWSQHQSWGKPRCVQHLLGTFQGNSTSKALQDSLSRNSCLPASGRGKDFVCSICMDQWLKTQKQGSGKRQVLKGRRKKGLRNSGQSESSWRFWSFRNMGDLALITQRMKDRKQHKDAGPNSN